MPSINTLECLAALTLTLTSQSIADSVVQYFYSAELDSCYWGQNQRYAPNETANCGLCAYVASIDRVYACPAQNKNCWTFDQNCVNGQAPGPDQILCTSNGADAQWCCQSQESCTLTDGQYNVCISRFGNPNANLDPAQAEAALYSAIPSSAIVTTEPAQATPSVFSTSTFATDSNTFSGSGTGTAGAVSNTITNTNASTTSNKSSNGISGGAIAGIIVGAVAGLALLSGTVIYLTLRHRRANHTSHAAAAFRQSEKPLVPDEPYYQPTSPSQNGTGEQYTPRDNTYVAEAPSDAAIRIPAEMDGTQYSVSRPPTPPHELP